MEDKHFIALVLLLLSGFGATALACLSQRVRDLFFFLLVTLSPFSERMAVNFFSRDWYRGTSRGFEFCALDVLSFSLLASMILAPRRGERRWFWPASLGLMIVYFLYAGVCVALADPKLFGLFELSKMLRGIVVFVAAALYLRSDRQLRVLVLALGAAVCFEGLTALTQRYYHGVHRVFGTVDDSNSLSMYLCTTGPVFAAVITSRFSKYLKALAAAAIALACIGVILTISRVGVITIGLMLLGGALATMSYKITPRKIAAVLFVSLVAIGVVAKAWHTLDARFKESTLQQEYEDKNRMGRGYYIRIAAAIAEDRWLGVGPNNWSYWVSNKYGPQLGWRFVPYSGTDREPSHVVPSGGNVDDAQAAPAHSLAALTAGEMGLGGLILLMLLWLRWLLMGASFLWPRTPDPMRRMGVGLFFGICGTFLQSFTEWVFHQTPIFFTVNILLGALASLYAVKKSRGSKAESREPETAVPAESAPDLQLSAFD